MNRKLSKIFGKTLLVLGKYPFTLLYSFIMTIAVICLVENNLFDDSTNYIILKILIVSSLGISISFALKMLTERNEKYKFLEFLLIFFLVGYYFILPENQEEFTEVYAYLLIPSYVLSHLLVSIIPYLKQKKSEIDFWEYNKKLFVNFFLTLVFTGVLCVGIELAILSIDHLFNLKFNDSFYLKVFLFFLIFGSTFIFTLFNINGLITLEERVEYPMVLKFFTQFVLIPLLIIYLIILYLYAIKILINWELPRGWVSYLVLAYSLLGILALLLVHPLRNITEKSWVRLFNKVYYYTLTPLLILLFVAIFTRLLEYGFTEARYFVLLIAIWVSSVFLYFVFYKKSNIKFIPISLFLFGLFALTFPFLNAFSIAKISQKRELKKILIENKLLKNGKIDFDQKVKISVVREIENKFDFLDNRKEREYLIDLLNDENSRKLKDENFSFWRLKNKFKSILIESENDFVNEFTALHNSKILYEPEEYDWVISLNASYEKRFEIDQDKFEIYTDKSQYKITLNEKQSVDLIPEIKEFFQHSDHSIDDLSLDFELESYKFKIVFENIRKNNYGNETSYYTKERYLFVKKVL